MKLLQASLLAVVLALTSVYVFAEPVDINTADAKTLDKSLKGIGPKTAAAIVSYRTKHGPFKSVDELQNVKGVRAATIEKNRGNLVAGAVEASDAKAPGESNVRKAKAK